MTVQELKVSLWMTVQELKVSLQMTVQELKASLRMTVQELKVSLWMTLQELKVSLQVTVQELKASLPITVQELKASLRMTVQELSCSYASILLIFVAGCGYHLPVARYARAVLTGFRPLGSKVRHFLYIVALRTATSDDYDYVMASVTSADVNIPYFYFVGRN
jgi:hypothetical protein